MAFSHLLLARDDSLDEDQSTYTPQMANTFVSILVLITMVAFCVGAYFFFRRRRQNSHQYLLPTHSKSVHHRQPSISTTSDGPRHSTVYIYDEKRTSSSPASHPAGGSVPEIRLTFPDEEGAWDSRKGGRVVVVTVGDSGTVGMEPVKEECLPPYPGTDSSRFQSLDLNQIGGIKEPKSWS